MTQQTNQRRIIRVNGSEELLPSKLSMREICKRIGCDMIDTVNLRRDDLVMLVDDTGMIDGKPVNPKATKLYHSVCRAGTVHPICGDVAVVYDGDFA